MGLDVEEYVASFRPDLADALFQWCRGASFAEIAKLSHVFEAGLPAIMQMLTHAELPERAFHLRAFLPFPCMSGICCELEPSRVSHGVALCMRLLRHHGRDSVLTSVRGELQGSLVRAVRRVEEVLRQAATGAGIMGEASLVALFQAGSERIKRDVIFAASLYL